MLRTAVYVDGYNLYYSRLQGGIYKWLDLVTLFEQILSEQDQGATLTALKYFTAPVKASYARHGQDSDIAQTNYYRALQLVHPTQIDIIKGFHVIERSHMPTYTEGVAPIKSERIAVWRVEEKQTDVNIALHVYRDAALGAVDQLVICSNDSDLEPSLRLVRQDFPNVQIGLVLPLKPSTPPLTTTSKRVANKRLTPLAHWVKHHIHDTELANAQLPHSIPTKKKPVRKPTHW